MNNLLNAYKGIAPGKVISHELKRKEISQREFSATICEHYQTVNAIIAGKRRLTLGQALKMENFFGFEEGFLLTLQTFHDIKLYKNTHSLAKTPHGVTPSIRKVVFWDVDIAKLDWIKYKDFIINRVNERGNDEEKQSVAQYYNLKNLN